MVALFTKIMGSGTSSVLLLARHSIVEAVLGKETPPLSPLVFVLATDLLWTY